MNCKQAQNKFIDLYFNNLNQQEKNLLLQHLDSCPSCRQKYSKLQKILDLQFNITQNSEPDPLLWLKIKNKISKNELSPASSAVLSKVYKLAIAAVISLLLLLGSWLISYNKINNLNLPENSFQTALFIPTNQLDAQYYYFLYPDQNPKNLTP